VTVGPILSLLMFPHSEILRLWRPLPTPELARAHPSKERTNYGFPLLYCGRPLIESTFEAALENGVETTKRYQSSSTSPVEEVQLSTLRSRTGSLGDPHREIWDTGSGAHVQARHTRRRAPFITINSNYSFLTNRKPVM